MLEQVKEKLGITRAHADRFFEADEDLPLSKHIMLTVIVLFFISFIVWANWATLDEITRGQGKVIPSSEIQIIQHQEGGIVEAFLVREGDEVKAGQVLIRLSDIGASSDYGANQKRFWGLQAKIARLQVEAEGKQVLSVPELWPDLDKAIAPTSRSALRSLLGQTCFSRRSPRRCRPWPFHTNPP